MNCSKCKAESDVLINGRCSKCWPFRVCKKCEVGTYESKPHPNWMGRWICDTCGHKTSR